MEVKFSPSRSEDKVERSQEEGEEEEKKIESVPVVEVPKSIAKLTEDARISMLDPGLK